MAQQTCFGLASANALGWTDYGTPRIPVYIYGPKGGLRGGGELAIDEARKLRDGLNAAIAEAEGAGHE
jgi:hypothetical protein